MRWPWRRTTPAGARAGAAGMALREIALGDRALWVIGDIHGARAELARLEACILQKAQGQPVCLVLLGDYIDRGADSAGVLDHLIAPPPEGLERICLSGNHEEMFAAFLARPRGDAPWLDFGGVETLASYGIWPEMLRAPRRHLEAAVASCLPGAHRAFLTELCALARCGPYLFAHAGIDPARPVTDQDLEALHWIRAPFLDHEGALPGIVVHGHTPVAAPDLRDWRINLDTGSGKGGVLTALRLDPAAQRGTQAVLDRIEA